MHPERTAFTWLNDAPDWAWLRGPQQLGTPWALAGSAGLLALTGYPRSAAAALLTLPALKSSEIAVKKTFRRPRPVHRVPTALRDDAPVEGGSMPSGHAALAAATAYHLASAAPGPLAPALWGVTAVACTVRVHQGAHWPSDALVGAALGLGVAAAATRAVSRVLS